MEINTSTKCKFMLIQGALVCPDGNPSTVDRWDAYMQQPGDLLDVSNIIARSMLSSKVWS